MTDTPLLCPSCHSDVLQEISRVIAVQDVSVYRRGDQAETDYPLSSEVDWDSGELLGVQCGMCSWEFNSPDYTSALVPGCTRCVSALSESDTDGLCTECRE